MPSRSLVRVLALCASIVLSSMAPGEEKPDVSRQGTLQLCLAAGLPPVDASNVWLNVIPQGTPDPTRPFAFRATGTLISTGEIVRIEDEALEHGCDLVIVNNEGLSTYYLLESAPDGPMPDTRRTLDLVSEQAIPLSAILFTRVEVADDPELLLLMRDEIDELAISRGIEAGSLPHYACRPVCELMDKP
jgi:hypothetical protein